MFLPNELRSPWKIVLCPLNLRNLERIDLPITNNSTNNLNSSTNSTNSNSTNNYITNINNT